MEIMYLVKGNNRRCKTRYAKCFRGYTNGKFAKAWIKENEERENFLKLEKKNIIQKLPKLVEV